MAQPSALLAKVLAQPKSKSKSKSGGAKRQNKGAGISNPSSMADVEKLAGEMKLDRMRMPPKLSLLPVMTPKEAKLSAEEKEKFYPVVSVDKLRALLESAAPWATREASATETLQGKMMRELMQSLVILLSQMEYALWVDATETDDSIGIMKGLKYLLISERAFAMLKVCSFLLDEANTEIAPVPRMNSLGQLMRSSTVVNGFLTT